MPKQTVEGKFEFDPSYNEEKHIVEDLQQYREYFEKQLSCIDSMEDKNLQLVCMFAMLDCLAQEEANYPENSKKAFMRFVLKYQKQCSYLECVEPVTLYYRIEDLIDEVPVFPGFPAEKEIEIDDAIYDEQHIEDVLSNGKAQEILEYIVRKKDTDFADNLAKEHQLISLIYRMRSKAVHELSGLGKDIPTLCDVEHTEPYYSESSRVYVQNGNWVSDYIVELMIPNIFIRNILSDCIDGYLSSCQANKHFPFSNNNMARKFRLSWYDK